MATDLVTVDVCPASWPAVEVRVLDAAEEILRHCRPGDECMVKVDIEGAEFPLVLWPTRDSASGGEEGENSPIRGSYVHINVPSRLAS